MRIIAGKYKSRKVYSPPNPNDENCIRNNLSGLRPTTDRARESLFNVLNNIIDFENVTCLDLFAGTGSLGFETLSRGAESCDFVESSKKQAEMIHRTAKELGCEDKITAYNENALKFLKLNVGRQYDIIFADPPYAYEDYDVLIEEVKGLQFTVFVLEHGAESRITQNLEGYDKTEKKTGAVNFKIFVKQ